MCEKENRYSYQIKGKASIPKYHKMIAASNTITKQFSLLLDRGEDYDNI